MDGIEASVSAALIGFPLGYAVAQILALKRWTGGMRAAALIPPLLWLAWYAAFRLDVSRDPTSHNLFPFEIMIGSAVSLVYLAFLAILRRLMPSRTG